MSIKSILRRQYHQLGLREIYLNRKFRQLEREWTDLRPKAEAQNALSRPESGPRRIVLLTAAPSHFNKSKGDEAMMSVVLRHLRAAHPGCEIHALASSDEGETRAEALGCIPLRMYRGEGLGPVFAKMTQIAPDDCFAIGADVMDGSYSQLYSLRMVALTDLGARLGARAGIFGFSFSKRPYPGLSRSFAAIRDGVTLNLRDPVSFERFTGFTTAPARQVADLAFQLVSDTESESYKAERIWIVNEKAAGRTVLGLNIHPSIMPMGERHKIPQIVEMTADILARLTAEEKVSVMLIIHDYSEEVSCATVLKPLAQALSDRGAEHVTLLERECTAAQLRTVVGALDGVVSARMHLAIAALGQSVPVMAINYKDKMEGLFRLFELDERALMPATRLQEDGLLERQIRDFVDNVDEHRAQVERRLPAVRKLSEKNFTDY